MEGKVIVDGMLASCYADIVNHDVAHLTMIPMQRFTELMNWIFGDDNGFPIFASTTRDMGTFMPELNARTLLKLLNLLLIIAISHSKTYILWKIIADNNRYNTIKTLVNRL